MSVPHPEEKVAKENTAKVCKVGHIISGRVLDT